jgi:hypothetical protein
MERNTLRVGYQILLEVGVNKETGEVEDVTAYPMDFNGVLPIHVFSDNEDYLKEDDERYKWAREIASTVRIPFHAEDLAVPHTVEP